MVSLFFMECALQARKIARTVGSVRASFPFLLAKRCRKASRKLVFGDISRQKIRAP